MASILTVDDSVSIRQAIKIALISEGHEVHEAVDGADGLNKARAGKFDMIITDLNMPNMNGLEMIRAMRSGGVQPGTPIVFLSTESDVDVKGQAKAAGATGWLSKPFNAEQLAGIVKKVLAR